MARYNPLFATLSSPMDNTESEEAARLDQLLQQSAAAKDHALGRASFDRYIGSQHGLPSDTSLLQQQLRAAQDPVENYIAELELARAARQRQLEAGERASVRDTAADQFEREWQRHQTEREEARAAAATGEARRQEEWEREFAQRAELEKLKGENILKNTLLKFQAKKGKGGSSGSGAGTKGANTLSDADIDAMDATPQQKILLKKARDKGDEVRETQIVNEVARVEAEKGKAKVATEADYNKVLRLVGKLKKARKDANGVPVGLDSRFAYADPNIGGNVGNAISGVLRFGSNVRSSPEEQENRRIYRTLIDTIRKEQFGASFTGGERVPYQEMFGLEASADPSVRVNALSDIEAKANEDLGILKRQRRGDVASGRPKAPATGGGGTVMLSKDGGPPKPTPKALADRLLKNHSKHFKIVQ